MIQCGDLRWGGEVRRHWVVEREAEAPALLNDDVAWLRHQLERLLFIDDRALSVQHQVEPSRSEMGPKRVQL